MSSKIRPLAAIQFIVVHHSASADSTTGIEDLMAERRRRNEGYNFIIDDDDAALDPTKGRDKKASFKQDAPDLQVSNGTYGLNAVAWNVCVDGNFEVSEPTPDEVECLIQVIATKARAFGWKRADVWRIITHKDAGEVYSRTRYVTACPGQHMIKLMPYIRQRIAAYLSS